MSTQVPKPCLRFTDNLKKDDIWTQSRQNLEEAIEEEKENTSHRWDPDLLSHEQRLEQRLDKLNLDMYIMGSDGACQVGQPAAFARGSAWSYCSAYCHPDHACGEACCPEFVACSFLDKPHSHETYGHVHMRV